MPRRYRREIENIGPDIWLSLKIVDAKGIASQAQGVTSLAAESALFAMHAKDC